MNNRDKYIFFSALILILLPITISTLSTNQISSTDWIYRHNEWINRYLRGDFTPVYEYPPLFHFLMLPFVYFDFPIIYFQIIFAILSTFGILYYVKKMENEKAMILMAMLMATSIAYIEFSSALMPQALDYFLFPLILIAYFRGKNLTVLTGITVIFFMHLTGIIFLGILLIHSLLAKRYKFMYAAVILMLVFLPISYYYVFSPFSYQFIWDFQAQTQWESFYISPIYRFFVLSGFLTWILLPFAGYKLIRQKFKFDEKLLLYVIWILGFLPLAIFNFGIWRAISYQIIPLSLFAATVISKALNSDEK